MLAEAVVFVNVIELFVFKAVTEKSTPSHWMSSGIVCSCISLHIHCTEHYFRSNCV